MESAQRALDGGVDLEASVTTMARRIAAGEKPYEQSVPDLTGYDVFMKPRQPWERKEA